MSSHSYAVSVDYSATSQILNLCIPAGSTSVSFTISVIDDDIYEADEMLMATIVILTNIANQSIFLGTPGVHTITILDNDGMYVHVYMQQVYICISVLIVGVCL